MLARSLTWLLMAALVVPSGVAGQTPGDSLPADSIRYLGGITVNVARPALTTGGSSAVVVDLDSLGHVPAPSMEDVIRSLPLIQVRTNSRGEAQPALRGSGDRQIAILMDGVPLTLGWDHRTDMSIIPLAAARNVTLVRGLSSVLYGPNTLGGVIDVDVARVQRRVDSVDPLSVGISLDETGGTNLSAIGGHLVDGGTDQWVFRGGAGFHDRRGTPLASGLMDDPNLRPRFLSDGDVRLNSDSRRVDGFIMARYRSDEGAWASVSASGTDVERGVPPEAHQDAPRLWRYPEQQRFIGAITAGTGQRETGLGLGDVEATVGMDRGSTLIEQFASEAYQTVTETEDADDRVVTVRLLGEHTLGTSGDLRASVTFADISHDEVLTLGTPSAYGQRMWSLAAETGWRFGPGSRTTVSLGGALDGADTPETGGQPGLEAMSDYGVRIGASSLVLPGLLIHGGLSRRARFPSLRELYSSALGRFEPNSTLGGETLIGSEAGFTVQGPAGELQLVGFHHQLDDGIVRTSVIGPGGTARFMRVNQAEVRSSGLDGPQHTRRRRPQTGMGSSRRPSSQRRFCF